MKKVIYNYTAVFEPEKRGYSVTIPELPGCISEGETFEEAQENIREAAQLYLEFSTTKKSKPVFQRSGFVVAPIRVAV